MRVVVSSFGVIAACAAAACAGPSDAGPAPDAAPGYPRVHLDVSVTETVVSVWALEPDRPEACSMRYLEPGAGCVHTSDVIECTEPLLGAWISELRVEADGRVLHREPFDGPAGAFPVDGIELAGATLIVAAADGTEAAIPLPDRTAPTPAIDDVVRDDTTAEVRWSASPAPASASVWIGSLLGGGHACHVVDVAPVALDAPLPGTPYVRVGVTAYAEADTVTTAFGDAHVRVGRSVSLRLDAPAR